MNFSGRTILVVEDHDIQRRMVLNLLKDLGATDVLEAADGLEALNLLAARTQAVDLILCDLDMPKMDGVALIGQVAERKLAQAVALISGLEASILHTVETMAKAYGLQVLGAIEKPLTLSELTLCLDRFQPQERKSEASPVPDDFTAEDLHRGLDMREFLAFFQPKVSFATGEVLSVEALVRWFRPGKGVVSPMAFIPQMDREHLVIPLTESLLEQTCAYLVAWRERGLNLTASVNVSMLCLSDVTFADRMSELVRTWGCESSQITLEVSETEVMHDAAKVLNVLARLRIKGFGLSMDDFGTGQSSLQQLSNLPFTELKVDQSFVTDSPIQPRHRTIVESSLELAKKLNLRTVAEGVETREGWDLLKSLGCEQAQGYFIARPMPGHQIPEWVQLWKVPEA